MTPEDDGILSELITENVYLRNELKKYRDVQSLSTWSSLPSMEVHTLGDFSVIEELSDRLKIAGIMIAEGIWNGVLYSREELKKMYNKFKDILAKLPIKVEHERTDTFKDKIVGQHSDVEWSDTIGGILFRGEVVDPKAIQLVKSGVLKGTSIKSIIKRETDGSITKATDIRPIDNSLTSCPACTPCQLIVSTEELNSDGKNIVNKFWGIIDASGDTEPSRSEVDIMENSDSNKVVTVTRSSTETNIEIPNDVAKTEDTNEVEYTETMAVVVPDNSTTEEECEVEIIPLEKAIDDKRTIIGLYKAGKYTKPSKKVKKRSMYYYYYPYYDDGYKDTSTYQPTWYYSPAYPYYPSYTYPYYEYYYPSKDTTPSKKRKLKDKEGKELQEETMTDELIDGFLILRSDDGKIVVFTKDGDDWKLSETFCTLEDAISFAKKCGYKEEYICDVCGAKFASEGGLEEHKKTHVSNTQEEQSTDTGSIESDGSDNSKIDTSITVPPVDVKQEDSTPSQEPVTVTESLEETPEVKTEEPVQEKTEPVKSEPPKTETVEAPTQPVSEPPKEQEQPRLTEEEILNVLIKNKDLLAELLIGDKKGK